MARQQEILELEALRQNLTIEVAQGTGEIGNDPAPFTKYSISPPPSIGLYEDLIHATGREFGLGQLMVKGYKNNDKTLNLIGAGDPDESHLQLATDLAQNIMSRRGLKAASLIFSQWGTEPIEYIVLPSSELEPISEEDASIILEQLDMGTSTYNHLKRAGIQRVGQLVGYTRERLQNEIPSLRKSHIEDIEDSLQRVRGLSLRASIDS